MLNEPVRAKFSEFKLPSSIEPREATVAIPVSNGMQQRYFFMNMKSGKGLQVCYPQRPGLRSREASEYLEHLTTFVMNPNHWVLPRVRAAFRRFHNGISFFELLFKVLKPHGITYIGGERFMVSLWSASIFFVVDLKQRRMEMHMQDKDRREVFSTYQFFDDEKNETYFATQLGVDEWYKHDKEAIHYDVPVKIKKYNWKTDQTTELWRGDFETDTHYLQLNKDRRYLALVNFGDFYDEKHQLMPSKILVLDLKTHKEWRVDNSGWQPTAHVDWDPVDPEACYFSCHNGVIGPVEDKWRFLRKKQYHWNIFGPASVHKYKMTATGPKKAGVFTHPDMERLTIHKVFMHRGKKLLACTGFPNHLFIANAQTMKLWKRYEVKNACGECTVMGSLFPSPDGEKLYLSTTKDGQGAFQVVDVATGNVDLIHDLGPVADPFNHMTAVCDTGW